MGVTQLEDVFCLVCYESATIWRFSATTHERLTDVDIKEASSLRDIIACEQTSQLYVAENARSVWRVSADGKHVEHWLPKSPSEKLKPWSLSVTSTRLLVTSRDAKQLIQFDAVGDELRRVQLPDDMEPEHAIESLTGTFIVSHKNTKLNQHQICEVYPDGEVLRQFTGSALSSLGYTPRIAVDSGGNVIVPDSDSRRILLLDAQLILRRVIVDEHQLNYKQPRCLCYTEHSGQLLVGFAGGVAVYNVLQH